MIDFTNFQLEKKLMVVQMEANCATNWFTKINALIDSVEQLSELQKEFLRKILKLRKELILDYAYNKLLEK